ncbi:MAG: hypothetical protein ACQEVA_02020 [Myxococcota bacterium]
MRKVIALTFVAALMLFSASAFAQDSGGDDSRSKFYDFNDMLVDGRLKTPDLMKTDARGKAKFNRLLQLKKSFIPKIRESTEEAALQ